jgi:hypothetical protein
MMSHQSLIDSDISVGFEDIKLASIIILDEILVDVCKLLVNNGVSVVTDRIPDFMFGSFSNVCNVTFSSLARVYATSNTISLCGKSKISLVDESKPFYLDRKPSPRKDILDVPDTPPTPQQSPEFNVEALGPCKRVPKLKNPTQITQVPVIIPAPTFQHLPVMQKVIPVDVNYKKFVGLKSPESKHSKYLKGGSNVEVITVYENFFTDYQIKNGKIFPITRHEEIPVRPQIQLPKGSYFDIDSILNDNYLTCSSYAAEIYKSFDQYEQTLNIKNVMKGQQHITSGMYESNVNWIASLHLTRRCVPEVFYLTVSYMNRYLSVVKTLTQKTFRLLTLACFFLADKMESIDNITIYELVRYGDFDYCRSEIVAMDIEIVHKLNFDMSLPTSHTFICRYLKCGGVDKRTVQIVCYINERVLQEAGFLEYLPSMIAASSLYVCREKIGKPEPWSNTLIYYTRYQMSDIQECVDRMKEVLKKKNGCNVIYNKYSGARFDCVAKLFDE